ncbi:hypothetical protein T440DRAFT_449847 [Plenodomus tracheiphilus IPT5]|uniref:Uncharacterized protein n=1 Tax=Plenodomus tracheiphilus IPT5 TaxID=1408161 RepID=A0A6A7B8G2_9PLEO|nr:hypothetical protein T440DRAFT_449847 [Plenodomus tracheiphilus IPT5]
MANEEQRRAFASYMGVRTPAASTNQGQSQGQAVPQYGRAVAQPAHPYLLNPACSRGYNSCQLTLSQQFPGLGVPPAVPTPPPAASSSVASFPRSGYSQASFPAGFGQSAYNQHGLAQHPPPLGQAPNLHNQRHMQQPGLAGYPQASGYYNAQPPPPPEFNAGWQQMDQNAEQARRWSGAPQGAVARNASQVIMESHLRHKDDYYYQQRRQPRLTSGVQAPPKQVEEVAVPVMLCHVCSHCGQMRSAGFHRNNPVVPGKPLVPTACRRCKKKVNRGHYDQSSFARIRTCTADRLCDWPSEPLHIDIDELERRGRRRSRAEVHASTYSPSRPRIFKRTSSQAHLGIGVLQQSPRDLTYERRVRVSSLSPHQAPRKGEIWPPPDIVRVCASRSETVFPVPPEPLINHTSSSIEVWPPPDIVHTHSFRKLKRSPSRRRSGRIIELSPSPPPDRTRLARVVFRGESQERRARSRSQSSVTRLREHRRSEDAQARLTAHPRPFRAVSATRHTILRASDETSSDNDLLPRNRAESPSRGILKPASLERVMDGQRANLHEARHSTNVDLGGPHVHFNPDKRAEDPVDRGRTKHTDERGKSGEVYEHFREYSSHRLVETSPPALPVEAFERLRVRRQPPSPGMDMKEDIRIDRARRISPSPQPARHFEETRVRHTSPLREQNRTNHGPPSPPTPERPPFPEYRHISRTRHVERSRSSTPPALRHTLKAEAEDVTDSDSAHSGELTEVRSWKGLDENGRPATFVEERRQVRMIEQGSERGGEFRPLTDRFAARSWNEV